jgi:sensor domain CHASE-containing protein
MGSINQLGTDIAELGIKAYLPFVILVIIVMVAIILASHAFPDDEEEE